MAFRNIIVENPARISAKNNQLIIATDREHSLPVEDISALLIESRQATITTAALSLLGQRGCAVFICDEKHMPCAVLNSYCQHSRQLKVTTEQINLGEVLRKHLWQSVVAAKIFNQAECLELCGNKTTSFQLSQSGYPVWKPETFCGLRHGENSSESSALHGGGRKRPASAEAAAAEPAPL